MEEVLHCIDHFKHIFIATLLLVQITHCAYYLYHRYMCYKNTIKRIDSNILRTQEPFCFTKIVVASKMHTQNGITIYVG